MLKINLNEDTLIVPQGLLTPVDLNKVKRYMLINESRNNAPDVIRLMGIRDGQYIFKMINKRNPKQSYTYKINKSEFK